MENRLKHWRNVLGELPVGQHFTGVNISAFVNNSASGNFVETMFRGTSPSGVIFIGPLDIFSGDSGLGLFVDPGASNIEPSAFRDATTGTGHVFAPDLWSSSVRALRRTCS